MKKKDNKKDEGVGEEEKSGRNKGKLRSKMKELKKRKKGNKL